MDLIRDILLQYEASPEYIHGVSVLNDLGDAQTIYGHMQILEDAGFLEPHVSGPPLDGAAAVHLGWHVTWAGHEFLDTVRDPEIWRQTKAGATRIGSWSVKLLADLATGFVRAKAAELGLPI